MPEFGECEADDGWYWHDTDKAFKQCLSTCKRCEKATAGTKCDPDDPEEQCFFDQARKPADTGDVCDCQNGYTAGTGDLCDYKDDGPNKNNNCGIRMFYNANNGNPKCDRCYPNCFTCNGPKDT